MFFSIQQFKNLPVVLIYLIGGLGAFFFRQTTLNWSANILSFFEVISVSVFGISVLGYCFSRTRKFFPIIIALSFYVFLFIFLPFCCSENASLRVFFIEIKAVVYLFAALLWCGSFGNPTSEAIYKCAKSFAILYLLNHLFFIVRLGFYSRFFHFVSECNYDIFLILLGFIFFANHGKKLWDLIIFSTAVCISGSLTGAIVFIVLVYMCYVPKNKLMSVFFLLSLFAGTYACFLIKYSTSFLQQIYNIDRVIFFMQAFESFKELPVSEKLLGCTWGEALPENSILPAFRFYVDLFENKNNVYGMYPFMLHSTYLRLLFGIGLPLLIIILSYFILRFLKAKHIEVKLFIIVFMFFSLSLSTMTIANGGVMLFITGIVVLFPSQNKNMKGLDDDNKIKTVI